MWVVISSCRDWIAWRTNIVKPNWRIVSSYKICIVPIIMYRWLFLMCNNLFYIYKMNQFLPVAIWYCLFGLKSMARTVVEKHSLICQDCFIVRTSHPLTVCSLTVAYCWQFWWGFHAPFVSLVDPLPSNWPRIISKICQFRIFSLVRSNTICANLQKKLSKTYLLISQLTCLRFSRRGCHEVLICCQQGPWFDLNFCHRRNQLNQEIDWCKKNCFFL